MKTQPVCVSWLDFRPDCCGGGNLMFMPQSHANCLCSCQIMMAGAISHDISRLISDCNLLDATFWLRCSRRSTFRAVVPPKSRLITWPPSQLDCHEFGAKTWPLKNNYNFTSWQTSTHWPIFNLSRL